MDVLALIFGRWMSSVGLPVYFRNRNAINFVLRSPVFVPALRLWNFDIVAAHLALLHQAVCIERPVFCIICNTQSVSLSLRKSNMNCFNRGHSIWPSSALLHQKTRTKIEQQFCYPSKRKVLSSICEYEGQQVMSSESQIAGRFTYILSLFPTSWSRIQRLYLDPWRNGLCCAKLCLQCKLKRPLPDCECSKVFVPLWLFLSIEGINACRTHRCYVWFIY